MRAYKGLRTLRQETKLSTWLFGIARNVAREALRNNQRNAHNVELDDPSVQEIRDERASPAAQLIDKEFKGVMQSALQRLDEDKRLVFILKVYQQRSYEEISEITGFSLPKIRNDLHRARAEMRRRLGAYLGVDDEM